MSRRLKIHKFLTNLRKAASSSNFDTRDQLIYPARLRVIRRVDREAYGARLESVCTLTRTEGSNPSLSATNRYKHMFYIYFK